jgi:hypothetical protein
MTQKIKILLFALVASASFTLGAGHVVMAAVSADGGGTGTTPTDTSATGSCTNGEVRSKTTGDCAPLKKASDCSVGVDPQDPTQCAPLGNGCNGNTANTCFTKNPIVKDINIIVDFLAALVGIVVIGTIILGGIQYSIAGDNAQATGAAKQRIINGLIALVAFIFTFAFLQWLIPGSV